MRNAFADEIISIAEKDPRFVLLSGDIGNRLFDRYKEKFSERFFNCGVAEANMMGMAAGLAMSGLRPYVYTITPFLTLRCYEQIKIDVCYHNLPVVIMGLGAGLSYAQNGATHQSLEDIAMMRVLPEMKVICPADAMELRSSLWTGIEQDGPLYIRMGKKNEPVVHKAKPEFNIGKSIAIKSTGEVAILSCGTTLPIAVEASKVLEAVNISTRVYSFHSVKPLDTETLENVFANCKLVISLEEHSIIGGAGSAIAEWCTDQRTPLSPLLRLGTRDEFVHVTGDQNYIRELNDLTPEGISSKIQQELKAIVR